jgi:hypothetical protein
MDIQVALQQEEARLRKQLNAIQGAIGALNGSHSVSPAARKGTGRKRTMSAAGRAKISKAAKARWAKFHAQKAKKSK